MSARELARISEPVFGHRGGDRIEFELTDLGGVRFGAADLVERPALLVFVPLAFTPICGQEIRDLHAFLAEQPDGTADFETVIVTCDSPATQWAWASHHGIDSVAWGSDFWPHGAASDRFGVFDDAHGHPLRATFLLDAGGAVAWSVVNPAGSARDVTWYADAIGNLGTLI